jgi:hypothetical protein
MEDKIMDLDRVVLDPNKAKHGRKEVEISKDESDTITFTRDNGAFTIKSIKRVNSDYPFYVLAPFDSTVGSDLIHRANSGPAMPEADHGTYTVTFDIPGTSGLTFDLKIKS